jgi:hypothetical protein
VNADLVFIGKKVSRMLLNEKTGEQVSVSFLFSGIT